jgi:hypothetical protein
MPKSTWIDSCTCLCRESKQASTLFLLAAAWLVIAGAYAKYKGVGTINGEGSYRFMITATDGDLLGGGKADEFRIRIWDDF